MPARIPAIIRDEVFQSFLGGLFRHQIAIKHEVSDATVSNVVAERRLSHGPELIDGLRALSLGLSRSGLSFSQCAVGHRIVMMLGNMGAGEEQYEGFIQKLWELYSRCGLAPDQLINEIEELHYFHETNQSMKKNVSIPKICEDIRKKQAEFKELDTNCNKLGESVTDLLHQKAAIEAELEFDKELKEKLKAKGLQTKEILETADLAALVKESGYSVREVTQRFVTFSGLDNACAEINDKIIKAGIKHDQLFSENEFLEQTKAKSSLRIHELELLDRLGFRLPEFKMIHNLINEIAEQRGLPTYEAVKVFLDDLRSNLYDYVDLRKKSEQLRSEIRELQENRNITIIAMNLSQEVFRVSELLARKGFKKDDLERISNFITEYCKPGTPMTTTTSSSDAKSSPSKKNFANSRKAGELVRANEAESQKWLDSSAAPGNDCDKGVLTQQAERRKAQYYFNKRVMLPSSKIVAKGNIIHERDALNRSVLKGGGAGNRVNNLSTSPRSGNENLSRASTSEDWNPMNPRDPSIELRQPAPTFRKKLETTRSAQQVKDFFRWEFEKGWQAISISALVDEAVLYPIMRQLGHKVERERER